MNEFEGRVGFCVGTGRCGTTFLAQVVGREPHVASSHERQRVSATFHLFCKWNEIAVDPQGFLENKERDVRRDLAEHQFSFECSALLSHSLEELYQRFRARFVLLVRRPEDVVNSFAVRQWYTGDYRRHDPQLPPSYDEEENIRHFLGRNLPRGAELARWRQLTQIGKLAWFWTARNGAVIQQFQNLPPSHTQIVLLEDLDYQCYLQMAEFLGFSPQIDLSTFRDFSLRRFNTGPRKPRRVSDWSELERSEFEAETAALAETLGYGRK